MQWPMTSRMARCEFRVGSSSPARTTSEAVGDAAGSGDEEVAGAAGGVADGEVEDRGFGGLGVLPATQASSSTGSRLGSSRQSMSGAGV